MKRGEAAQVSSMLIVVVSLLLTAGCATTLSNRAVEFGPLTERSFGSFSKPAQVSKESGDQLYAKGFARLGSLAVVQVLERCTSAESGAEKCEKIPQSIGPTADLLQEAASRGGEIVTLLEDAKGEKKATAGKNCFRMETVREYSSMVYYKGQYSPGMVTRSECAEWRTTLSRELHIVSSGIVWKLDPDLAKSQQDKDKLARAAADGDLTRVRSFVERGIPADSRDPSGIPIVAWAASSGNQDLVEYLMSKGAQLCAKDFLLSPLEMAANSQDLKMMRFLISKGANVDRRNSAGSTPLLTACLKQQTDVVRVLLEAGADVNAKNDKGITPLMAAVRGGRGEFTKEDHNMLGQDPEIPRMLLERGVNPAAADNEGKRVLEHAAETVEFGKAAAFYLNWRIGAFGYVDKQGKWVIKPSHQQAFPFSGGLATVVDWYYDIESEKTGFIDRTGKLVIAPRFHFVGNFHEGLALVRIDGRKYGYIDKTGNFVIEPVYSDAGRFYEGLAYVKKGGKYGYINKNGVFVIAPQFDEATGFEDGIARVEIKDDAGKSMYGFINKAGAWAIPPRFDKPGMFSDGLARFSQIVDGKPLWGFIDRSGKTVIPAQFIEVGVFSDGLANVLEDQDGKPRWGYIDRAGKVVVPPRFSKAYPFSNGIGQVREQATFTSSLWFINKKGEVLFEGRYDNVYDFHEGLAPAVMNKGLLGRPAVAYIDPSGNEVLKFDSLGSANADWDGSGYNIRRLTLSITPHVSARQFSEGLAAVRVQGDAFLKAWRAEENMKKQH
jgi:ankyrin repeat protein